MMKLHYPPDYLEGRLFEWTMTTAMILLSVEIFLWPQTLEASAFHWLVLVLPAEIIGVVMLFVGTSRATALFINGRSILYGPRIRAVGALVGAVMWAQFDLALLMPFLMNEKAIPSPGIPFWFTFTAAELYTVYRATTDVRNRSI